MKHYSKEIEEEIRNRLDYMRDTIYNQSPSLADTEWSYLTINNLLFYIYMLEEELKRVESG